MKNSLFNIPDWQMFAPTLVDRYSIEKGSDFDTLLANEEINTDFFIQLITIFNSEHELPIEQLKSFPLPVILDYLEKTHRYYINTKLNEIEQSITNLQKRIPENELLPFLVSFFEWVKQNLIFHIQMEEDQLFPYIKALIAQVPVPATFSIQTFIDSHTDTIELQMSEVKKHIVRAQQTASEIFPFRILLKQMNDFEKDLRIHAKIEDEVLIPLAKILEVCK